MDPNATWQFRLVFFRFSDELLALWGGHASSEIGLIVSTSTCSWIRIVWVHPPGAPEVLHKKGCREHLGYSEVWVPSGCARAGRGAQGCLSFPILTTFVSWFFSIIKTQIHSHLASLVIFIWKNFSICETGNIIKIIPATIKKKCCYFNKCYNFSKHQMRER